jgi:hypothetical protein
MLTQISIELTRWIEHQKYITTGLTSLDRKTTTCYSRYVTKVCLRHWFPLLEEDTIINSPKPQPVQGEK